MFRVVSVFIAALLSLSGFSAGLAAAQTADYRAAFQQSLRGQWSGKGQIVAGRYKGVKFSCKFKTPDSAGVYMRLDGTCRTGLLSTPIKAEINQQGGTLQGRFNEGAQAKGLDIVSGTVNKNSMVLELNREKLKGNMTAQLRGDNNLHITLAVHIDEETIPVIGMDLTRADPAPALAAAKTGSVLAWLQD